MPKGTRSREGDRPVPRPLIAAEPARSTNMLQTLDRGVQVLTIVSQRADGISIAELAEELGVHRAIAYRLAATLEGHDLIRRSGSGQLRLGVGVLTLASRFQPQLRSLAAPLLRTLAATVNAAAFLSVAEGNDCVAVMVAEATNTFLRVSYRIGSRHGLEVGAAGIAILSGRAWSANESEAVTQARRSGYSLTRGQLQPGAIGIASPIQAAVDTPRSFEASVGVVALDDFDVSAGADAVMACARRLGGAMGPGHAVS